ncbi:MAG TPA: amidohydrolase family protein [Candidatus Acidoferrum sp.]|nr:amidohydrolase family protein [Candidatus Acidoferrum sp.]
MSRRRTVSYAAVLLVAGCGSGKVAVGQESRGLAAPAEQGRFTLHKMEQAIGVETYAITKDGHDQSVAVKFKFTDRGTEVPLDAAFRGSEDLTPQSFSIKGKNARTVDIDEAVEVQADQIRVRDREKWVEVAKPKQFFTIAGYAPATMQMLLFRYWTGHGSPKELQTFPSGHVRIEPRGKDTVMILGKKEAVDRYSVEGLIWGHETVWFDGQKNLVALVSVDAEFDHFEAIRDGYEEALGTFVTQAGADGMALLAELSKTISGSRAKTMALVGGTLVDGTGRDPLRDSVVVIQDGRIIAAGGSSTPIPPEATRIDASGKTILPGLWDMHAHFEQVEWGPIYLAAGATTVRDCGNEFEFITAVRDAIAQGKGLGPRLLLAGIVDGSGPLQLGVARVDTPAQGLEWVHRYHDANFQQIKIYSSVKLEEIKVIAGEAHGLGMTVTGHVPEGLNAYQTIEAGQDQINHVQYILQIMLTPYPEKMDRVARMKAMGELDLQSPEAMKAIDFLKSHKTVVDPTLTVFEFVTASTAKPPESFEPGVNKVPIELRQALNDVGPPTPAIEAEEKVVEKMILTTGMLHRAGVPIVAGTDQTVPGHSLYRELELYVQAGFTPMEAIQAATIVPARVMGFDKELGTVEVGKRADLIVLKGNPLESIRNIRKVESVITNGTLYNCAELWQMVGFQP